METRSSLTLRQKRTERILLITFLTRRSQLFDKIIRTKFLTKHIFQSTLVSELLDHPEEVTLFHLC